MRPIRDRAVASSSSAEGPVTKQIVAEACDTLIREKHPASPPEWPKDTGTPAQGDQSWMGETKILQEPPPPRRKTASTPRPEKGGSPTRAEQGPIHATWSPSPVVRTEKPSALRARETEESGSVEAMGQRTSKAGGRSDTTQWYGPLSIRKKTPGTRRD